MSLLKELVGETPLKQLRIRLWNGDYYEGGAGEGAPATLVLKHPGALRSMLLGGSEIALGEAYLRDDFDVEGNLEAAFELAQRLRSRPGGGLPEKLRLAFLLKKLPRLPRQASALPKATLNGAPHSVERDRAAIEFHYDVSNDFYGLWLDSRRVYSCGYFRNASDGLDLAQWQKLDLVCRKLGLAAGDRLLDIGCGWGGLLLHAASNYGVKATGITLSRQQADYATEQIARQGLQGQVEVLLADYRTLEQIDRLGSFDAVASIGMVEHVGRNRLVDYFSAALRLLKPGGLFLNHGIGTGPVPEQKQEKQWKEQKRGGGSFAQAYVFPDGELVSIGEMLTVAEGAGFEIRDVENLREHYCQTLRHWVSRLEQAHEAALNFVTEPVYRVWRLYMSGAAHSFDTGRLAVYQTLLAKLDQKVRTRAGLTREGWYMA